MTAAPHRMRDFINRIEEILLALLLAFMTCMTFIQVVLRYVFNTGILWSLEATTYAFAWLVLIGMSYGVRTKTHIAVDILIRHFPPAWKHIAALLVAALCLVYCGLMLYGSYLFVDGLYTIGHMARDIAVPRWALTIIMPIAFILLAFRFLEAGWNVIQGKDEDMVFSERNASSEVRVRTDNQEGADR